VKYEKGFYIPEDYILHSHRRENLKSYNCVRDNRMDYSRESGNRRYRQLPTPALRYASR
jgi:hypothetical protein